MNNYFLLFTQPHMADFTLYHMGNQFKCNSSILCGISPVIKKLDKKSFSLPSVKGSLNDVFRTIFSFGNNQIDSKSINLLIATAITLDIQQEIIIQSLSDKKINPKDIYMLANELISNNVKIDIIVPIIASKIDYYIQFFARDISYESFTPCKLSLYSQVFSNDKITTEDPHNLLKFVGCLFNMFPETFNSSVTNISKKYFNHKIFGLLIQLKNYDLNQISEKVIPYISEQKNLESVFKSIGAYSVTYNKRGKELEGFFNFMIKLDLISRNIKVNTAEFIDDNVPENLLIREEGDSNNRRFFASKEIQSSVTFNLCGIKFKPAAYVMKSHFDASNGMAPISWKLEASFAKDDDDFTWVLLDTVKNCRDLCENDAIKVFPLDDFHQSFSRIRITQTESNGFKGFYLSRFEMFGEIYI